MDQAPPQFYSLLLLPERHDKCQHTHQGLSTAPLPVATAYAEISMPTLLSIGLILTCCTGQGQATAQQSWH